MLQIDSNIETLSVTDEKAYSVLTGFMGRTLEGVPGITDWKATENGCSFSVQGVANCNVAIAERVPFSKVVYRISTDKGISADVVFTLTPVGAAETELQGRLSADVPFFLQGMVKGLLEKFTGSAMQYLKKAIENS
ncbi:MAG: hypothetical protein SPL42_03960 [Bacteroidales bacterium]|nr:hypothetical protein [Bacteroidales bacterium]